MTPRADDPIRAEVERVLRALVAVTVIVPLRVSTAVPRCLLRHIARAGPLAEPVRVMRSLVDLAGAGVGACGVISPDDAPTPAEAAVAPTPEPAAAAVDATTELPIADYESLAASHVVDRLPTLTQAELAAVRAF